MRRWLVGLLVAGTVAGSAIVVVTPFSGGGAPAGTANLFVDLTPGSCTWQATPQPYNDAASCADTATAYSTANTNSPTSAATVGIRSGSYPLQSIPDSTRTGANIAFFTTNGPVTIVELKVFGDKTSWTSANGLMTFSPEGIDTVGGPDISSGSAANRMKGATFDGVSAQGGGTGQVSPNGDTAWYVYNAQDVTFKNGEICCGVGYVNNGNQKALVVGTTQLPGTAGLTSDNFTIDNNYIHDWRRGDDGNVHTECLFLMSVQSWTITNNRFDNCALYGISLGRLGGDADPANVLIANNAMTPSDDLTVGDEAHPAPIVLDHVNTRYVNLRIRNNSLAGPPEIDTGDVPDSTGFDDTIFESNIIRNLTACAPAGTTQPTFRGNLMDGGVTCGASNTLVGSVLTGWTLTSGAWDFHLQVGAAAIGKASTVAGQFTTTDIGGFPRDGAPDAGAYEFGSGS